MIFCVLDQTSETLLTFRGLWCQDRQATDELNIVYSP
jgi:hypothetical protein